MAQPYVSGPAHIFAGVGKGNAILYLGTAEDAPDMDADPAWAPVVNDIGGQKPIDYSYQREEAMVSMVLNRFNWPNILPCMTRPGGAGGIPGTNVSGDVGTLMILEGKAYPLWIQFPYAAKPAYATMPAGRHYFAAFLWGPEKIKPGTKAKKVHLIFKCMSVYNAKSGAFPLYDANMSGLPAPD